VLSVLIYLQEQLEEPFEINLLLPLMGLVFCGLPLFMTALILYALMKRLRNREDPISQEKPAKEQMREGRSNSDDHL
jgi:hypothetical protein